MSTATHTPGPWQISKTQPDIETTGGTGICSLYGQNTADARLIAAAPDLLAACQHALETFGGLRPDAYAAASRKEYGMLLAAINKANGWDSTKEYL